MPSFFIPTTRDLTAQESPPPGNLPCKAKKMLMPRVSSGGGGGGGGWVQVELTDVLAVAIIFVH